MQVSHTGVTLVTGSMSDRCYLDERCYVANCDTKALIIFHILLLLFD